MKILFVSGVFENDATGAARFAKLIYQKGGTSFTILTEDTKGGDRIINVDRKPKFYQTKLWQYFRIAHYRKLLYKHQNEFDAFLFNNSLLAYGFKSSKPCYTFVHDEKLMKVNRSLRFDFIRKNIFRRIEKSVLESGIRVISNSNYISNRISKCYNVDPKNISLLYQGINLVDKLHPYNKKFSGDPIKILFVKNDYLIGGFLELVRALALLEKYTFEVTIIGPTNLNLQAVDHSENVTFNNQGIMFNEYVIKCMYDHDILCIPARFEPLGVAVMEGLAIGIPTVTTGVGGLPEVTNNGEYVWECEPNNPESIAEQIEACITNPKLRKVKSTFGIEHIHANFNINDVVSRLKKIIN